MTMRLLKSIWEMQRNNQLIEDNNIIFKGIKNKTLGRKRRALYLILVENLLPPPRTKSCLKLITFKNPHNSFSINVEKITIQVIQDTLLDKFLTKTEPTLNQLFLLRWILFLLKTNRIPQIFL